MHYHRTWQLCSQFLPPIADNLPFRQDTQRPSARHKWDDNLEQHAGNSFIKSIACQLPSFSFTSFFLSLQQDSLKKKVEGREMGFPLLVDRTKQHRGARFCFLKSPQGEGGGGHWMGCAEPGVKHLASEWNTESAACSLQGAGKGSQAPYPCHSFILTAHRNTRPAPSTTYRFVYKSCLLD